MTAAMPHTLNLGGSLMSLSEPKVMGILNVTPDSFYAASRVFDSREIACRARQIAEAGGAIIDVGAYSTRPGSAPVDEDEEWARLRRALSVVGKEVPGMPVSVDTFRAEVARRCVEEFGVGIVNDVSGGADPQMFPTVARLGVAYVLSHIGGTIGDMQSGAPLTSRSESDAPYLQGVLGFLAGRVDRLRSLGAKDIIVDPGFGFGKSMEQNYSLLNNLDQLGVLGLPVLAGLSRKSMIWKLLGTDPDHALGGTIVCNTIALMRGAAILRVHDVADAVEAVRIVKAAMRD